MFELGGLPIDGLWMILYQVENILSTYEPQACMVVYSIIDRDSFLEAEEILEYLNMQSCKDRRARILVGNKVDLERSRQVSAKGGCQNS